MNIQNLDFTGDKVKLGSSQRNQTNGEISGMVRQSERGMHLFTGHLPLPDHWVRQWRKEGQARGGDK